MLLSLKRMKRPSRDQSEGFRIRPSSVIRCSSAAPLTSLRHKPFLENTMVLPSGDQMGLSEIPEEDVKRLRILRSASSIQRFPPGPPRSNLLITTRLPSGDKRKSCAVSLKLASGLPARSNQISPPGFVGALFLLNSRIPVGETSAGSGGTGLGPIS